MTNFIVGKHYFHVFQHDNNFNNIVINEIVIRSMEKSPYDNNIYINFNNIKGEFYNTMTDKNVILWCYENKNDAIDEVIRIKKEIIFNKEVEIKNINKEIIELTKSKN